MLISWQTIGNPDKKKLLGFGVSQVFVIKKITPKYGAKIKVNYVIFAFALPK